MSPPSSPRGNGLTVAWHEPTRAEEKKEEAINELKVWCLPTHPFISILLHPGVAPQSISIRCACRAMRALCLCSYTVRVMYAGCCSAFHLVNCCFFFCMKTYSTCINTCNKKSDSRSAVDRFCLSHVKLQTELSSTQSYHQFSIFFILRIIYTEWNRDKVKVKLCWAKVQRNPHGGFTLNQKRYCTYCHGRLTHLYWFVCLS